MRLNIIKPMEKQIIEILWIDFKTPVGDFVIQEKHIPMIVSLAKDSKVTYCLLNGIEQILFVKKGIIHITREYVSLLLNS